MMEVWIACGFGNDSPPPGTTNMFKKDVHHVGYLVFKKQAHF